MLLNKYQEVWEEIHRTTMAQADSAVIAAREISALHLYVQKQDALLTQLTSHIAEIPALADTIDKCTGNWKMRSYIALSMIGYYDDEEAV